MGISRTRKTREEENEKDIQRFLRWYSSGEATTETLRGRRCLLRRVAAWVSEHHRARLRDASYQQLQEWRQTLTCSNASAAVYISGLHVYFTYLVEVEEYRRDDPSQRVRRPRRVKKPSPNPVDEHQVFIALEGAQDDRELFAMLMVMRYGGLRRKEVAGLRTEDVVARTGGGLWLRVRGKRDRVRRVPVAREVGVALAPFLSGRGPVFTHPEGRAYTPAELGRKVNDYLDSVDIGHTGHHLRHSFATRTMAVGANIRQLQVLLGHESLEYIPYYTEVEPEGAADVVDLMTRRSMDDAHRDRDPPRRRRRVS
jgi:integrase/recombinase XerD